MSYLNDKFIMRSHDTDYRLNQIVHNSFCKDRRLDSFVYEIARELDVSVDYLYGWVEEPLRFVPQKSNNTIQKQGEILRLLNKYTLEQEIEKRNTNVLAAETNIDREVFEYLFSQETDWSYTITTSYYILAMLAIRFDFNLYTVMSYLLDAEEYADQDELVRYYGQVFERDYGIRAV